MRVTYTPEFDTPLGGKLIPLNEAGDTRVELRRTGRGRFSVAYGKEIHQDCTYEQAAQKLGEALLHRATCAGHMD